MKRVLTLFLSVVMVCSVPFTVWGEGKAGSVENLIYDKEEIEEVARKLFLLTPAFQLNGSDYREDKRTGEAIWYLYFYNQTQNSYFYCNFDAKTAEMLSFDQTLENNKNLLQITEEEAKQYALSCIERYNPGLINILIEDKSSGVSFIKPSYYSRYTYYFTFVPVIDDVAFPSDFISLQVSGYDGTVVAYQKVWSKWTYENKGSFLPLPAVLSKFRTKDFIKAEYIRKYDSDSDTYILTPVYRLEYPEKESGLLNAVDGNFILSEDIYDYRSVGTANLEKIEYAKSADQEVAYLTVPEKGVISAEKAVEFMKEKLSFLTEVKDMVALSTDYTSRFNGVDGKYWRIYLYLPETKSYLSAVIDGEHPKICSVRYEKSEEPIAPYTELPAEYVTRQVTSALEKENLLTVSLASVDEKETRELGRLKDMLIDIIRKEFPEMDQSQINLDRYEVFPDSNQETYWGYRTIEGIPYKSDRLHFTVNTQSNEIVGFSMSWTHNAKIEYEGCLVPVTQAQNLLYGTAGFDLYFIRLRDKTTADYLNLPFPELVPVYSVKQTYFSYISAISGDFLDYNGQPAKPDIYQGEYDDISGHKNEKAIKLMTYMGYLEDNGLSFEPDDALLKKDLIKWLGNAFCDNTDYIPRGSNYSINSSVVKFYDYSSDESDFYSIVKAVRMGVIHKDDKVLQPEKKMSILEMSKLIINGLGLEHMANTPGLFAFDANLPEAVLKDAGTVALAKYYGVINKNEQNFNRIVTRGEAVQSIYDLLVRLRKVM